MSVFSAIVGLIKAIPIVDGWMQQLVALYVTQQTAATLQGIVDAAAMAARAKTDEERYVAADAWRIALSKSRQL